MCVCGRLPQAVGLGKGAAGLVANPILGAAQALTDVADGASATVSDLTSVKRAAAAAVTHQRPRRVLYELYRAVRVYNLYVCALRGWRLYN